MKEISIEEDLVEGCKQRKADAQEAVYRKAYAPFMQICLRYTGNYEDAVNVLQDSFLKIFTRVDAYTGKGAFVGWMKRIVVNSAIDFVRKQKQESIVSLEKAGELAEEVDSEKEWLVDEKQLIQTISELPAMHKLVFNLFVMDDCSHKEIAERLSISVSTSKWYLFDARKILQKKLAIYLYD